jgi:putative Mn2+ efflux pump MntP
MDLFLSLLLGAGLAMDCLAVSLAASTTNPALKIRIAFVLGVSFALFQTGMTLAGWAAGSSVVSLIGEYDHWVAFLILGIIGGKMVYEGSTGGEERDPVDYLSIPTVILLSLATSMDALGVGLTLGFLESGILGTALIIGLVSFLFSCGGAVLGGSLARQFGSRIEVLGGIILIVIGARILVGHLFLI